MVYLLRKSIAVLCAVAAAVSAQDHEPITNFTEFLEAGNFSLPSRIPALGEHLVLLRPDHEAGINRTFLAELLAENNITTAEQLAVGLGNLREQLGFILANSTDPELIERLRKLPSVLGIDTNEPIVLPNIPNPDGVPTTEDIPMNYTAAAAADRRRRQVICPADACCYKSTNVVNIPSIDLYNLERLNHGFLQYDGYYNYSTVGVNEEPMIDVYVFDTGITLDHTDFQGRAYDGLDTINEFPSGDNNGHGTHVAGIVGGRTFGAAKNVNLISVKVLDREGAGSSLNILLGMTWLYGVVSRQNPRRPTIINLSLGGEYSDTMNQYVQTMAEIGILVVTASGNSNSDACLESPASAALAISVASSGRTDEFSSFSNWGACVDVIAPGENILSASYTGEGALIKSGTSQACPLVAGLAAIFWESSLRNGTNVTIQQLAETMKNNVNTNLITNTPEGTVNSLAHASACSQPRVNSAVRMPMSVGLFVAAALVSVALLA